MREVTQTRVGVPQGNCTEACIASILECPIEDVPDLYDAETGKGHSPERWNLLCAWLKERGYLWLWGEIRLRKGAHFPVLEELHASWSREDPTFKLDWRGYHFLAGPNPDGAPHCIVAKYGCPVWDPNPLQRGITGVDGFGMLAPLSQLPEEYRSWPAIGMTLEELDADDPRNKNATHSRSVQE